MQKNMIEALEFAAQKFPNKTAFTFLIDGEGQEIKITFLELAIRAKAIAAMLQKKLPPTTGSEVAERILLIYEPGLDFIAGFFGCLYAGVIAVPVVPPENEAFVAKLQLVIEDAKPKFCLSTTNIHWQITQLSAAKFVSSLPGISSVWNYFNTTKKVTQLAKWDFDKLEWLTTDKLNLSLAETWLKPVIEHNHLAFLQYTSGSTGQPKGVMVSHSNLLHNLECIRQQFRLHEESCTVFWLPPYHDMGLIGGILQGIYSQYSVILFSPLHFLQSPLRWLQAISKYRATVTGAPNFAFELCLKK
ncbi:MAG: AMP-binding protein, partial [Gammaproteobacteria bacterium]